MATTAKGTPYVVSTDLVANYPTVSSDLATHIDAKLAYNAVSINAQTGTTYTFALADASEGKLVTASNAASQTFTVPPQSSVTWAAGAVLRILNQGAGTVTIAGGSGVTINGTPLTLAQYRGAAIQRTAADTWTFVPFTGGVGNANFSDAATGTFSSGGVNYKYITYNASGTLTITTAGFADVLLVGGGGGGGVLYAGGGGAGGHFAQNVYLPAGSLTITVGAGGSAGPNNDTAGNPGRNGNPSRIGDLYYGIGGGGGGCNTFTSGGVTHTINGLTGGSGGGSYLTGTGGSGVSGVGNNGGNGGTNSGGGGGGAGAVGSNGTTNTGAAGGAGTASSITGSSVTRAAGGGGGGNTSGGTGGTGGGGNGGAAATSAGTAGTANSGSGGGGAYGLGAGAGGSGVVIVRVIT